MPPGQREDALRDHLRDLLTPAVEAAGLDLEDVAVSTAGRRTVIRVVVDSDLGADLDVVAQASRAVSDLLDAESGELAGPFVLEVSSPGVDRPLTEPRHWRRSVGRLVTAPVAGAGVTGRVREVDDAGVLLDVDGTARHVAWSDLGRGRVQVEFTHVDEEV